MGARSALVAGRDPAFPIAISGWRRDYDQRLTNLEVVGVENIC